MSIPQYIAHITQRYKLGNATEHTFRNDLRELIESLMPDIRDTIEQQTIDQPEPSRPLQRK